MIDALTNSQIDHVLRSQQIGRIGCHADGKTYVIPVSYAFYGKHIYAHSRAGLKVNIMRKNPAVCFQVDIIENMANWRSVIVWGKYEELKINALQVKAYKLLNDHFTPVITSESAKPTRSNGKGPEGLMKQLRPVLLRISTLERAGRYEKT